MTFNKWLLLVLFVIGFLWIAGSFPQILQYSCHFGIGLAICGGIYGLCIGRLVDEFGYEIKGKWVRMVCALVIILGVWLIQYCPTTMVRERRQGQADGGSWSVLDRVNQSQSAMCTCLLSRRQP